ncbi:LysE family translocator [Sabulicella rubraurantiaca]|uniref:LysE family translocator n=1 Tax=Sabulicella rubraurantiaca TaxID=2811429 RepID=UPI001A96B3B4|nr:LysE family translocator [Sabulicella rubraurantiaca]
MEGAGWLAAVTGFAFAMAATPGPNNAMVTASGANWGFRRTVPHILGISLGFPFMFLAVALGAGEALRLLPWLNGVLRWVGAAYLLWLAWRIATAVPATGKEAHGRPFSFLQAALFQWVNPKAWMIALGGIAAYATGEGSAFLVQAALLTAIFTAVTLPVVAFWTLAGVGAARFLRSEAALRRFNLAMALLLVLSLVPVLWS